MRITPNFGKKESVKPSGKDDGWACIFMPLMIVVSWFVLSAIARYTSGTGNQLDRIICYGALIFFLIMMLIAGIQTVKQYAAREAERVRWIKGSMSTEAFIMDREGFPGGSYEDEYGIPHTARAQYRLKLMLPNQMNVNVDVSEKLYKTLENRDNVRIYYKPESPWTFLLEEEI